MELREITSEESNSILLYREGHFGDLKSKDVSPEKLTRTLSALANAEGGELFIGIREDTQTKERYWEGFTDQESANGHIQAFERLFPLGKDILYTFLHSDLRDGLVMKVEVRKTLDIKRATNGTPYVRRGAQNIPVTDDITLRILERNKGISSFENEVARAPVEVIIESENILSFIKAVVPQTEPIPWLKKQQLLSNEGPTVGGVVLFADEPQAILPKRSGLKIYRYETSDREGSRDTLVFDPLSIEGCGYNQIKKAVEETAKIIESIRINTPEGMRTISYPREALHEIITNAVLHRDYSITDDIHIVIFDNRVEIKSPGSLPGHVTPENILDQRFARNPTIVRLMNKFPDAPNKDVGEGLNTAFEAMRKMKLKDPVVNQDGGYVTVVLKHESLASPEERILEYLSTNETITNGIAREICFVGSENKMKRILQKMVANKILEPVATRSRRSASYRLYSKREAT